MRAQRGTMHRRVRRRQCRLSDAVNRAIDDAVEKFWRITVNTQCMRGRVKRRGRERDADLLVIVCNPRFGAVRGHAAAPATSFVKALGDRFRTFVINEYNTSKRCDVCGAALIKTRPHSVRYWRYPNAGGGMVVAADGKGGTAASRTKTSSRADRC